MITGGTGTFGQAFVRRLLSGDEYERICVYSRGEHRQADMRQALNDDERLRWFIGDVRDTNRLRRAMHGVDVVVHAAALKRIEAVEYNVHEAVATNIIGTMNVVEAAIDAGVKKVVMLSTDKASAPRTLYGYTKAAAEAVILGAASYAGGYNTIFAVTRYGNIAGSQGSVIPTWRKLAAQKHAVPITDPECTRFFMWPDEAVNLVLKAINTMEGGEIYVPNLPAYRLGDLAEAMGVDTYVTGLQCNEKLHEQMEDGNTSDTARRMTIEELRSCLEAIP